MTPQKGREVQMGWGDLESYVRSQILRVTEEETDANVVAQAVLQLVREYVDGPAVWHPRLGAVDALVAERDAALSRASDLERAFDNMESDLAAAVARVEAAQPNEAWMNDLRETINRRDDAEREIRALGVRLAETERQRDEYRISHDAIETVRYDCGLAERRAVEAEQRLAAVRAIADVTKIDEDRPEWILGYNDALWDVRHALGSAAAGPVVPPNAERCFECGGTGRTSRVEYGEDLVNGPDDGSLTEACDVCGGAGVNYPDPDDRGPVVPPEPLGRIELATRDDGVWRKGIPEAPGGPVVPPDEMPRHAFNEGTPTTFVSTSLRERGFCGFEHNGEACIASVDAPVHTYPRGPVVPPEPEETGDRK